MRTSGLFVIMVLLAGCVTAPRPAGDGKAVKIKHDDGDVPREVREIEVQVERRAAIMAEVVEISVSRNYEWDVSLTGDSVTRQSGGGDGERVSIATGHARASFRNLEIRAWKKIVFRKSGFDVTPYIRITAQGRAAHAVLDPETQTPVVRRAPVIRIDNAEIQYLDRPGGAAPADPAATVGTGDGPAPALGVRR